MDRSPTNVSAATAGADDDDATVVIEIRRGGIPRYLAWTVDKLIRYDHRWTPYDVVFNGVSRGRLGPRGSRRMRATVQPGRIAIELASVSSGLVYETAELDVEAGERVIFRYLPARSFFDAAKPSELRRVKNRRKSNRIRQGR